MSRVRVHAGDFLPENGSFRYDSLILKTAEQPWAGETIPLTQLETVEVASEENVKRIGGTIGWGAVGMVAAGPVGLLAGLLLGGKKKEITFVAKFKDGRRLFATTDNGTFIKLQAALFSTSISTKDSNQPQQSALPAVDAVPPKPPSSPVGETHDHQ